MRASMEYRVLLAKTLVLRAINETLS